VPDARLSWVSLALNLPFSAWLAKFLLTSIILPEIKALFLDKKKSPLVEGGRGTRAILSS
jgi:hypothetical protein